MRTHALRHTGRSLKSKESKLPRLRDVTAQWMADLADELEKFEAKRKSSEKSDIYAASKIAEKIKKHIEKSKSEFAEAVALEESKIGKSINGKREKFMNSKYTEEVRSALRQLPATERLKVVIDAVQEGDPHMTAAIYDAPAFLVGVGTNELDRVRQIVDERFFTDEADQQSEIINLKNLIENFEIPVLKDIDQFTKTQKPIIDEVAKLMAALS